MQPVFYEVLARHITDHLGLSRSAPAVSILDNYLAILWENIDFGEEQEHGQEVKIDDGEIHGCFQLAGDMQHVLLELHAYMTTTLSQWAMSLVKYHHYGRKTFNISRGLTQMLHTTDLGGPYSMLEYPFPMFYLNFEKAPITIMVGDEEDHVAGVYIDATRTSSKVIYIAVGKKGYWERWALPSAIDPMQQIDVNDFQRRNQRQESPALELAVKTVLYLNSTNSETEENTEYAQAFARLEQAKEAKKKDRLNKHLTTISSIEYIDVGRNIKINKDPAGHSEARDRVENAEGWHYNYKFWVRGHFRNQAYGKGRKERKSLWIQPHLKGPDEGDVIHKQYDVG